MPQPKIHEQIDMEIFGKSYFDKVHKWIDGTFNGTNGRTHWINRHYVLAVLEHFNPKDFPDGEYREQLIMVARLHILMDWMFYYKRIILPLTQQEVIRELRSEGVFIE